ncbi:MAG: hypothetical protein L0Z07_03045, partial [Planctomycetes bacterium]|nr:hypothetical protein [Planctomycetota bacterium]
MRLLRLGILPITATGGTPVPRVDQVDLVPRWSRELFSQTAEYALRTMAFLGKRWPAAATTAQIAEVTQVP